MDFELSDEQNLLRGTVREFARQEVAPVAAELDREARFPYELAQKLGELGLMGIPFPEEYGGGGADTVSCAMAIEELARVDASLAITLAAHTSLGTMPIHLWGSEEQKSQWLPDLCGGRKLAAFGLTEPEARLGYRKPRVLGQAVVAHVSPKAGTGLEEASLRAHCADRLEDHMVPRRIVIHEELPRTSNGKVDRAALSAQEG